MPVPVRLRLARHGHRHNPIFHLVAINSAKPRNARPLETLGEYDPIPKVASSSALPIASQIFGEKNVSVVKKEKRVEWDVSRINYWLGVGAQPTKSVVRLLERGGILTSPHKWQHRYSPAPSAPGAGSTGQSSPKASSPQSTSSWNRGSATPPLQAKMTGFEGKTAS